MTKPKYSTQCILGIKLSGFSMKIDSLEFGSDQSNYDCICNVNLSSSMNGNGSFDITILDKNYQAGCPIRNWKLISGAITFNWGDSIAKFILADQENHRTYQIEASKSSGTGSNFGFDIDVLTRSIFSKAQQIISEFPSAEIYNMYIDFQNISKDYNIDYYVLKKSELKDFSTNFNSFVRKIQNVIDTYNRAKKLLNECKDDRVNSLHVKFDDEYRNFIQKNFSE